jgi:DNA repair exonuclease SbcCD nuclease subunit
MAARMAGRDGEEEPVLKLLHTADWHLGRRFRSFSEEQEKRLTRARLEVLERVLGVAERYAVDAVLCAGDLFDEPLPGAEWWQPLAQLFSRRAWANRPVFLLPGNHDPLLSESIWAKEHKFRSLLPPWVHVVDREGFEVELSPGAVLYAVPCQSKAGQRDPTESIPRRAPGDERIRVGLVHGSTFDAREYQTNFPISKDAALERGLDYLAIGDTHGFRFVPPDRAIPPTVYPGTPEPTAFDERDPGSVAVVLINRQRRATVKQERVAFWTWEEREVRTLDELVKLARRTNLGDRVLRLKLEMTLSAPEYDEAERLLEELAGTIARPGRVGVLELDRQGLELETRDVDAFCADLPDVLRAAVLKLKEAANQPDQRLTAQRALFHLYRVARNKGG